MNVAIVLTHNKTNAENEAMIDFLVPLVVKNEQKDALYDRETKQPTGEFVTTYYYTIKGFPNHRVKFYQIIPFGVTPPYNIYKLDSHKVYYAKGDEDKTGDHPRFFNWGLKRATDYGADLVIHLNDIPSFTITGLVAALAKMALNGTDLFEANWGKISTLKLLRQVGQLDEKVNLTTAFTNLKTRITQKGLKYGT